MVSTPAILQVFSVVVTLFNGIAAAFLQYSQHPSGRYSEKVEELQKDRWSEVSTELGELSVEIQDLIHDASENSNNSEPWEDDDITPEAKHSLVIQTELNRDELDGLGDKLEDVDTPRERFTECRESRDVAIKRFFAGFLGALIALIVAFAPTVVGGGVVAASAFSGIFSGLSAAAFVSALNRGRHWLNARQELDQMWEEYNYM